MHKATDAATNNTNTTTTINTATGTRTNMLNHKVVSTHLLEQRRTQVPTVRRQIADKPLTMSAVLDVRDATERTALVWQMADHHNWSASTVKTHLARLIKRAPSYQKRWFGEMMATLTRRRLREGPSWDATLEKSCVQTQDLQRLVTLLTTVPVDHRHFGGLLAHATAGITGNRSSDLLRIQTRHVWEGVVYLGDTKTCTSIGAYCLHLPMQVRQAWAQLKLLRSKQGQHFLFLDNQPRQSWKEPEQEYTKRISLAMRAAQRRFKLYFHWNKDLRGLRRGALIRMSSKGFKDEEIRKISRHQTESSLRGYLAAGLFSKDEKDIQAAMFTL